MEKLLEKIGNLKEVLDKEEVIIRINKLNKEILNDKSLLEQIEEYKKKPSNELKEKIYNNNSYKKYKESETDLNLLIMLINSKLKEINNERNCK